MSLEPEGASKALQAAWESEQRRGQGGPDAALTPETLNAIVTVLPDVHRDCEAGSALACWLYEKDYGHLARYARDNKQVAVGVVADLCSGGNAVACAMERYAQASGAHGDVERDCELGPTEACVRALAAEAKKQGRIVGMDQADARKRLRSACDTGWIQGCGGLLVLEAEPKEDFYRSDLFRIAKQACGTGDLQVCTRILDHLMPKGASPEAPVSTAKAQELLAAAKDATARARGLFVSACERGYLRLCSSSILDAAIQNFELKLRPQTSEAQNPPALPPTQYVMREDWLFSLPGEFAPVSVLPLADGTILVAAEFGGVQNLPGIGEFIATDAQDILLFKLSASGQVNAASTIGGDGDQRVSALTLAGTEPYLAMSSMQPASILGKSYAPERKPGDFLPKDVAIVVSLEPNGKPKGVIATYTDARVSALGLPSGQLVVAVQANADDASHAIGFGLKGTREWTRSLGQAHVEHLFNDSSGALVAVAEKERRSELTLLRLQGDKEPETVATIKAPSDGDERPTLEGIVELDGKWFGYGSVGEIRARQKTLCLFTLDAQKEIKPQGLVSAIGAVRAVGKLDGEPLALVDVVHHFPIGTAQQLPYLGSYVARGHQPPFEFVPILQTSRSELRGNRDQVPETKIIFGMPFSVASDGAKFVAKGLVLAGRCGSSPGVGCVRKMSFTTQP